MVRDAGLTALVKDASPPATPARPTVDSVAHDAVTIGWADPADSTITGYQVLRRTPAIHDRGHFEVIEDDTGSSDASYVDTDVEPETKYTYRVQARNAHGLSGRSGYVTTTTPEDPTPPNTAPTGRPTIAGMAQVGETLNADTSGMSDGNGLTGVQYTYQWIRGDGTTDTDISGATAQTYTLISDDQGHTVKVSVSFTDDDGYAETLNSAATGSVARPANEAATGLPTITGTAQVGGDAGRGHLGHQRRERADRRQYTYRWIRGDGTTDTDISGATAQTYP